jgi:hypothetical protein
MTEKRNPFKEERMSMLHRRWRLATALLMTAATGSGYAADKVELSLNQLPFNSAGQETVQNALATRSATNGVAALLGSQDSFEMRAARKTGRVDNRCSAASR